MAGGRLEKWLRPDLILPRRRHRRRTGERPEFSDPIPHYEYREEDRNGTRIFFHTPDTMLDTLHDQPIVNNRVFGYRRTTDNTQRMHLGFTNQFGVHVLYMHYELGGAAEVEAEGIRQDVLFEISNRNVNSLPNASLSLGEVGVTQHGDTLRIYQASHRDERIMRRRVITWLRDVQQIRKMLRSAPDSGKFYHQLTNDKNREVFNIGRENWIVSLPADLPDGFVESCFDEALRYEDDVSGAELVEVTGFENVMRALQATEDRGL